MGKQKHQESKVQARQQPVPLGRQLKQSSSIYPAICHDKLILKGYLFSSSFLPPILTARQHPVQQKLPGSMTVERASKG